MTTSVVQISNFSNFKFHLFLLSACILAFGMCHFAVCEGPGMRGELVRGGVSSNAMDEKRMKME